MTESKIQTKRVNELKPGDVFTYCGLKKVVTRITDRIYYKGINESGKGYEYFGLNSQQKVEFLYNKRI